MPPRAPTFWPAYFLASPPCSFTALIGPICGWPWLQKLAAALTPYEQMLAHSEFLLDARPVFVDFTAKWCLSCQVNERVALGQPGVEQAFQARNVVLMKADWTRHDEDITQALTALGRSGVPAYALYVPGEASPQLLPEVLTPGIVEDAVSKLKQ